MASYSPRTEILHCVQNDRVKGPSHDRCCLDLFPPPTVILGRSADNRKAPLNFSFPLEGKCHVVAKGCTRVSIPMKLTIVLLGPTSADLETLCRVSTKRRILVRTVSRGNATKYQSAGSVLQVLGPCMNSYGFIFATHRDSSLRSE